MNQRAFNHLLYRTLLVPLALLGLLAGVLLWEVHYLRTAMQWVDHTDQVVASSRQLMRLAVDAETGVRGYLLTGDEQFLEPYQATEQVMDSRVTDLNMLVADNPAQQIRLKHIDDTFTQWEQYAAELIRLRRDRGNYTDVALTLRGKQLMDSVRQQRDEFLRVEEELRAERVRWAARASRLVIFSGVAMTLGGGLIIAFFTRNQMNELMSEFGGALAEAENRAAELARSERRWMTTLTSIGDAVIATDAQGNINFMNDLAQRLSGWKLDEVSGKPSDDIFRVINEESGEKIENPVMRAIRLNRVVELANHALLLGKNGERVPVEDSAAPIIDANQRMIGSILVFRDVTERRRRERERKQALFNEQVSRRMAEEAAVKLRRIQAVTDAALAHATLETLLQQLLHRSCDALNGDIAVILLADEAEQCLHVRAAIGMEEEVQAKVKIPIGKGIAGTVAATGQRRIISDLSRVEVHSRILKERVSSLVAVPLVVENRTIGVMHVDSVHPRVFTEDEAELLQVVGDRVALAIDRAQREDRLQKIGRTLKALNNSNQALLRATNEAELLNLVCNIVTKDCGHSMVWVGYAENDEGKTVRPVAHAGFEQGYLETLQLTWGDTERGRGPTGTAIRTGRPSGCSDMLNDPSFAPWREEAIRRGYASSLVVPLMDGNRAFGSMTIYSKETNAFAPAEAKLLQELAGDVSYGIISLRARKAHAEAQAAVEEAAEQRRLALDGAELGAWEVQPDNNHVDWDERCQKMFGLVDGASLTYEEAMSQIHDEDRPRIHHAVQGALAGANEGAYHVDFRVVWPDRTVHWVESYGRVYFEGEGNSRKAVRFIGVNKDITDRKKAEDALRDSEQRWATTLSSIGDAVISTDVTGGIIFMNDVAVGLTGWQLSEAKGRALDEVFNIVNEVTRKKPESPVAKVIRLNEIVGLANHTVLIRRDGTEVPIDDSAAPIHDRNGVVDGVVLVFRDVSERKKAEVLLRNSERLAITGRMAASIAHEIHNPLDTVGNLLYVMQNDRDPKSVKKYAAMAAEEVNRVVQMTKHMLAFNREARKPTPVRLNEVMATVTELYARKIQMAGVNIEQHIEFKDEIEAFPSELRQVLANLVGNAIEAVSPKGKIVVHAYAGRDWKRHRRGLRIVIADSGHGIEKSIRDRIFDPFFTTKGDAGTGLGLWITSGLVEKHDGTLRVWSSTREGKSGTCFSVFLPLQASGGKATKVRSKGATS